MLISEIRERTSQGLLDFAWRQWALTGVSANVTGTDRWAIDPEALVLFTAGLASRDPRLFDEMLDWLALNHKLLSIQRLRNLNSRFPVDPQLVNAIIAWIREPARGNTKSPERPTELTPVFSRDVVGFIAKADPTFEEFGFIRPPAARSRKSKEPDSRLPPNLAFQLRHLFGPGSRAEVMRILLTYPDRALDAARIADEVAYAKRNVNEALMSLVASGTVKTTWSGNERHFNADRDAWALLLRFGQEGVPLFVSWVYLLPAALELLLWLDSEMDSTDSAYIVASRTHDLMDRIADGLETAGIELPRGIPARGAEYLAVFEDINDRLLAQLETGG